jgi:uncharacterized membrane protein YesL
MIGFMIKKTFFDTWDNLFSVAILQIGFFLLTALPVFIPYQLNSVHPALSLAALGAGILLLFVYASAVSLMARDMCDYKQAGFQEFAACVKEGWKTGVIFGIIAIIYIVVLLTAVPFYMGIKSFPATAALVALFWISLFLLLAAQYFFPVRARLDRSIKKIIKKSFLIFLDNTAFTVFLGLGSAGILLLSALTFFFVPGFTVLLMWLHTGFKLRLMKYDYLELNPQADRRHIPWETILQEERERVGKRTLKGMIFPWKE